jgi:hypothetical protein
VITLQRARERIRCSRPTARLLMRRVDTRSETHQSIALVLIVSVAAKSVDYECDTSNKSGSSNSNADTNDGVLCAR